MKHYWVLALLAGLSSCSFPRAATPSRASATSQEAPRILNSLVSAIKNFDSGALGNMVSRDYTDSQGRTRLQLLDSLHQDRERYLNSDISVFNVYTQASHNGEALLRFDFTWRGVPKAGAEKKLQGQAEWVLKQEGGQLTLIKASGDSLVGIP